jgi:hypothetical protein
VTRQQDYASGFSHDDALSASILRQLLGSLAQLFFNWRAPNHRDVKFLGKSDDGVHELAKLLGWAVCTLVCCMVVFIRTRSSVPNAQ